jgi:adenylosuccinate synthase
VPVRERLRISPACPLILPYHVELDLARETARGAQKIGTTGRGIGPAYEDKAARRGVRLGDLFYWQGFAAKLAEVMEYHNFMLTEYYKTGPVDFQQTLEQCAARWPSSSSRWWPTSCRCCTSCAKPARTSCSKAPRAPCSTSTSAPIRSSPRRTPPPAARRWAAASAPATSTTCSASPRRTPPGSARGRSHGAVRRRGPASRRAGHEFGSTTGRARRCGWFDAVALRQAVQINSISGLCITKLDVLDGLETIRVCVDYQTHDGLQGMARFANEYYAGISRSIRNCPAGSRRHWASSRYDELPDNAKPTCSTSRTRWG